MADSYSILVVDDDQLFRQTLVALIETRHTRVIEAASAEQALELYRQHLPALVFVDVNLPRMSGIEFVRLIGKDNPQTLIAVITGKPDDSTIIEAFQAGASDFLLKPVERAAVEGVLNRARNVFARRQSKLLKAALFDELKIEMKLPSDLRAINPAVSFILSQLEGIASHSDMLRIEVAMQEALRNAFEHGNFGIGAKEKQRLIEAGDFEAILEQRSLEAQKLGKKVLVSAQLAAGVFECTISDSGVGFDWQSVMTDVQPPKASLSPSGRGIFLLRQFFDAVEFNDTGNSIRLKKQLRP